MAVAVVVVERSAVAGVGVRAAVTRGVALTAEAMEVVMETAAKEAN